MMFLLCGWRAHASLSAPRAPAQRLLMLLQFRSFDDVQLVSGSPVSVPHRVLAADYATDTVTPEHSAQVRPPGV